jgi:hypothetical protein
VRELVRRRNVQLGLLLHLDHDLLELRVDRGERHVSTGDTSCESICEEDYSTGMTEAENLRTCICSTACASSCGTSAYCTETL